MHPRKFRVQLYGFTLYAILKTDGIILIMKLRVDVEAPLQQYKPSSLLLL